MSDDVLDQFDDRPEDPLTSDATGDMIGGTTVDAVGETTGVRSGDTTSDSRPGPWGRAVERVLGRPQAWLAAPWPVERIVRLVVTLLLVGGSTFAALQVIHPRLVLTNNTPTGGDMGAHVMGPAFLRDVLLPNGQLSGWSNYWYAGFPMYRFYMVVPALAIVLLNVVLPYGIAFKIVVVSGIVTLPLCCWAFGRLARFRYPMPELFALGGLLFLFDESFSIYGGNVKSTMAGEFSFSIALSLAMLGLGLFARGLETGKYRCWAAIVLALACLSHGIVLLFVVLGALLLWLIWMDRTRLWYGFTVGLSAFLLAAFWVVPFLFNHAYMTDMKYGFRPSGPNDSFWDMFFPLTTFFDIVITVFAVIGFIASIARRHLNGAWLGISTLALVAAVYVTRDSLPVIGLLWNPRLLPFVYLLRYLLMMVGFVEAALLVTRAVRGSVDIPERLGTIVNTTVAGVLMLAVLVIELMFFQVMPGAGMQTHNGKSVYQWGPFSLSTTASDAQGDGWSRYNFTGYEDKPAYGEYRSLVTTMGDLGADPAFGCGRAMWENNGETGAYGTTMSLMLLPHWTNGCIASMEGLFFEASGTTPYHFITAAAISKQSSNPVRQLRYEDNNAAKGVPYLQTLGVKYVMVFTEKAREQADAQPELTLVRTVGPWNIYTVTGTELVEPLAFQPVVVNAREGDARERNLELGTSWFQQRSDWAAMPADGGPAAWQRIDVDVDLARRQNDRVDIVTPVQAIEPVPLPAVTVSNIVLGEQDLTFDVDQIGVPVLVKVSYFPNWQVSGADGPWRIAPNLMVVVPTATTVHLTYERSGLDITAYLLTLIGIGLLVFWRFRGDVQHRTASPLDRGAQVVAPGIDDEFGLYPGADLWAGFEGGPGPGSGPGSGPGFDESSDPTPAAVAAPWQSASEWTAVSSWDDPTTAMDRPTSPFDLTAEAERPDRPEPDHPSGSV